jgi:hypothetical protein
MIYALPRYTFSGLQNFNKVRKLNTSLVKICTEFFLAIMRGHLDEGGQKMMIVTQTVELVMLQLIRFQWVAVYG